MDVIKKVLHDSNEREREMQREKEGETEIKGERL